MSNLRELKECLGDAKYNKINNLIKECLQEGLEVEITIPKSKLINEGLFGLGGGIKGVKGKKVTIGLEYGKWAKYRGIMQSNGITAGSGWSLDGMDSSRPIKNDKETVANWLESFAKSLQKANDSGEISLPDGFTIDFDIMGEDGKSIDCGLLRMGKKESGKIDLTIGQILK